MVKSVVKSFLPKHTAAEKRENARKTEILRAFGGRLTRRSHAPKRRALPAAPHPGVKLFGGFVCGLICALSPLLRAVMLKCRGVRGALSIKSTARLLPGSVRRGTRACDRYSGNLYALGCRQNRAVLFSFSGVRYGIRTHDLQGHNLTR